MKTRRTLASLRHPDRQARKRIKKAKKFASIEIEPWSEANVAPLPVTAADFAKWSERHGLAFALSARVLKQTKQELAETVLELGAPDPEAGRIALESIEHSRDYFSGIVKVLDCAQSRLLIAASSLLADGRI